MKKKLKVLGITYILIIVLFIFGFNFLTIVKTSYAIDTGINRSDIPSNMFTSNISNTNQTNYIKTALTSNGNTSTFIENFSIPSNMKINNKNTPLYKMQKNFDTPTNTEKFEMIDENPININDLGISYILSHGYNTNNTTNTIFETKTYGSITDNNIKQYITQIALWLYIYENKNKFSNTYCNNNGCDFLDTNNSLVSSESIRQLIESAGNISNYKYLKYITLLVDKAKNYTGETEIQLTPISGNNLSYEINDEFTLLTTETITPTVSKNENNFMYYSIEINDSNNYGVYITDNKNNKITNMNVLTGSFKVVVPLKEELETMNLSSIEINIYGNFIKDETYEYRVTSKTTGELTKHDNFSNVLLGYNPNEIVKTSFKLHNFTQINKVDKNDSKPLTGATLIIKRKDSEEEVETWVSTNEPHYTYLSNGDYELCEKEAPNGYKLAECKDFSIDDTTIKVITLENELIVENIPNTSSKKNILIYLIGTILILAGSITTIIVLKKNNSLVK